MNHIFYKYCQVSLFLYSGNHFSKESLTLSHNPPSLFMNLLRYFTVIATTLVPHSVGNETVKESTWWTQAWMFQKQRGGNSCWDSQLLTQSRVLHDGLSQKHCDKSTVPKISHVLLIAKGRGPCLWLGMGIIWKAIKTSPAWYTAEKEHCYLLSKSTLRVQYWGILHP